MKRVLLSALLFLITGSGYSAELVLPADVSAERMAMELAWDKVHAWPVGKRPRVIVVLGGGGAKGLAHIGVLRALEEQRIPVDQIVGVSVGALIGALYADGLPIAKIEDMANNIGWHNLTDFSKIGMIKLILDDELLSTNRMQAYLEKHIGQKNFSDLKIPFTCIATDLRTGDRVVFREGPVAMAARASATIPGIFRPVEYRQRYLVDGGLVDNLPTNTVVVDENDFVLAIQPRSDVESKEYQNVFGSLVRAMEIQKDALIAEKKKVADFMIEPNVGTVSMVDLGRTKDCIEAGTLAAHKSAHDLKRAILTRIMNRTLGDEAKVFP
jgi:NTE family protein